jgi:hypothetical protein
MPIGGGYFPNTAFYSSASGLSVSSMSIARRFVRPKIRVYRAPISKYLKQGPLFWPSRLSGGSFIGSVL